MSSFFERQMYFYDMNWGYDNKKEMFDTYEHVARKLKFEDQKNSKTSRDFNANKVLLGSIIKFEDMKEKISKQPENVQDQYMFQLEMGFASQFAQYNHIRGTEYSTQHFKLS